MLEDTIHDGKHHPGYDPSSNMFDKLIVQYNALSARNKEQLDHLEAQLALLAQPPADSHELRANINTLIEGIKDDLEKQKELFIAAEQAAPSPDTGLVEVASDLQFLLSRFQSCQIRAKQRFEQFLDKAKGLAQYDPVDDHSPLITIPSPQQVALAEEITFHEELIEDRAAGIKEIQQAMEDVREIFRDLGLLVSEQQLGIDNIEANLEAVASRTRHANRELERTNEYRTARAWTIYSIFIFILILLIILMVVLSV